jgi:hypothetical protein
MTMTIFISSGIILKKKNCQWKTDSTINGETIMAVIVGIEIGEAEQTSLGKYILHLTYTAIGRGIHFQFV